MIIPGEVYYDSDGYFIPLKKIQCYGDNAWEYIAIRDNEVRYVTEPGSCYLDSFVVYRKQCDKEDIKLLFITTVFKNLRLNE